MPTATYSSAGIELSLDFEMYCKTCGCGICNNTDKRGQRGDHENVFETYCDNCIDEHKRATERIAELEQRNEEYVDEIADLKNKMYILEQKLIVQHR